MVNLRMLIVTINRRFAFWPLPNDTSGTISFNHLHVESQPRHRSDFNGTSSYI